MKNLLEAAEDYTKQAGWRDLAQLKCCMCALGLLLGLAVPSGVCADTGETAEGAVRAHVTVAFHAPKPCHRLAAEQCGTVVTADIGIGAALGEG